MQAHRGWGTGVNVYLLMLNFGVRWGWVVKEIQAASRPVERPGTIYTQ
jgi:hypothetical protein